MKKAHLGILVRYQSTTKHPPFIEQSYFKNLSIYGEKTGVTVTVFSPLFMDWKAKKVQGYRYNQKKKIWEKGDYPVPHILYDRIAYSNRSQIRMHHAAITRLVQNRNISLLGRGLPGKWNVYNMVKDIPEIKSFLPETILYQPDLNWEAKLQEHTSIFFKPASGSNGKGVFRVWTVNQQVLIQGRNKANKVFQRTFPSVKKANEWIKSFMSSRSYIIQPYLQLDSTEGHPFDLRILLQKDEHGQWRETGRAARIGQKFTLTSNIKGGGTALEANYLLNQFFAPTQVKQINQDISTILKHVPKNLEERHGQLIELGVDLGVDRSGHVWILEVNSKPGRESLKLSKNLKAYQASIQSPINYACFIASQSGGNVV
ncbi:YheC/YheD family protein [Bacillus horti]|uniref:Glutathione synthase/RimK-type ligase-like ATP-grasp enzyme n=1 Tax=Caldalkalibacillus horti TaxID=77523 RepID=A0ABT9VWB3_9BACI|nr:YheC/YheD family protein [Bacillus horti]MDQ0165185.1 glutathione synthase/RimK-type ligase-like ATP-grasp enzyme [Bacillus horti]